MSDRVMMRGRFGELRKQKKRKLDSKQNQPEPQKTEDSPQPSAEDSNTITTILSTPTGACIYFPRYLRFDALFAILSVLV